MRLKEKGKRKRDERRAGKRPLGNQDKGFGERWAAAGVAPECASMLAREPNGCKWD